MHCFLPAGWGKGSEEIRAAEKRHTCPQPVQRILKNQAGGEELQKLHSEVRQKTTALRIVTILCILFALYAVPGLLESSLLPLAGTWTACIVAGDLAGCLFLYFILGKRRTAVALYLGLTILEGCLYTAGLASPVALVWISDLVPALLACYLVARDM